MSENGPKKPSDEPWPEKYPDWYIAVLESIMEETGMSRKEAIEHLENELLFGGCLIQEYAANARAHKQGKSEPETPCGGQS
jgi:hypothetical protein